MRTLVVVVSTEPIKLNLLRLEVGGRRVAERLLECAMHPLMASVLLGSSRSDALGKNAQPNPPHGEL